MNNMGTLRAHGAKPLMFQGKINYFRTIHRGQSKDTKKNQKTL